MRYQAFDSPASRIEGNVYVRPAGVATPLISWAPVDATTLERSFASVDEFRKAYPKFDVGSQQLALEPSAVLKSPVLSNVELTQPLTIEAKTPPDVLKLLGWSEADARTPGAYPRR